MVCQEEYKGFFYIILFYLKRGSGIFGGGGRAGLGWDGMGWDGMEWDWDWGDQEDDGLVGGPGQR